MARAVVVWGLLFVQFCCLAWAVWMARRWSRMYTQERKAWGRLFGIAVDVADHHPEVALEILERMGPVPGSSGDRNSYGRGPCRHLAPYPGCPKCWPSRRWQ